jgi:hypothetical protein
LDVLREELATGASQSPKVDDDEEVLRLQPLPDIPTLPITPDQPHQRLLLVANDERAQRSALLAEWHVDMFVLRYNLHSGVVKGILDRCRTTRPNLALLELPSAGSSSHTINNKRLRHVTTLAEELRRLNVHILVHALDKSMAWQASAIQEFRRLTWLQHGHISWCRTMVTGDYPSSRKQLYLTDLTTTDMDCACPRALHHQDDPAKQHPGRFLTGWLRLLRER